MKLEHLPEQDGVRRLTQDRDDWRATGKVFVTERQPRYYGSKWRRRTM